MRKLAGMIAFIGAMFGAIVCTNFFAGNGDHILANPSGAIIIGGGWALICAALCAAFERPSWNYLGYAVASGIFSALTFLVIGYFVFWSRGIDPVFKSGILTFAGVIAATVVYGAFGGAAYRFYAGRKPAA